MLVCSRGTNRYFPDEDEVMVVTCPPKIDILEKMDTYDKVIAVGGGSVIDVAKIVAKDVICYPTTAAGSCSTSHSVCWDGTKKVSIKRKIPLETHIVNEFLQTLPEDIKEYTTYDVLSHCLDSLWSKDSTYKNEYYCYRALEILEGNYDTYELVAVGKLGGMAIELCPTTILHSLSYPITGFYGVPHGKALGFLLPAICDYMNFNLSKYINYPKVTIDNLDIDLIIREGVKYEKIFNVNKEVDLDKIKELIKEYS